MTRSSRSGGAANWAGADFELRLAVQYCVYMLVGESAGLGAVSTVQLQAPGPIDDLVIRFASGAKWAIQAKAGQLNVSWKPSSRFGEALRQLYCGATRGQIDLSPDSPDRVVLAVDSRAAQTVTEFASWLEKAQHHHEWRRFEEACASSAEKLWVEHVPTLLEAEADDALLAFLRRVKVERAPPPDVSRQNLRGLLVANSIVSDGDTADHVLDVLLPQVQKAAPRSGELTREDILRACERADIKIRAAPAAGLLESFYFLQKPDEDLLRNLLDVGPVRLGHFVERPELASALSSEAGALIIGKKGGGKSSALIRVVMARPPMPVVVILRGFRPENLDSLVSFRHKESYCLVWDDIHLKPGLFVDAVEKLRERGHSVSIVCSLRAEEEAATQEFLPPGFWERAGIGSGAIRLNDFDHRQAEEICVALAKALGLRMDKHARERFAEHVVRGDGGPLFAASLAIILRKKGSQVKAGDIEGLPGQLVEAWQQLYQRLNGKPHMQSLLHCLKFLHDINCPLDGALVKKLYTRGLSRSDEDFRLAAEGLERELWVSRREGLFACHDVPLEAVPKSEERFLVFAELARKGWDGDQVAMGLLRGTLSSYYQVGIEKTGTKEEREGLVRNTIEFGGLALESFRSPGHFPYLATVLSNLSGALHELAALETSREGRADILKKGVHYVEEAIRIRSGLGLQAEIATSLNNASAFYSELAALETSREGRAGILKKGVDYVEEAIRIHSGLDLQAGMATCLNNASNLCSELAALEVGREGRADILKKAVVYVEQAIRIRRGLGLQAGIASCLNNASNRYSELATLETTHKKRVGILKKAVDYVEEGIGIYRGLGLQAEIASSLNNASSRYRGLATLETTRKERIGILKKAVDYVEEAVGIYRRLGLQADIAMSLNNASNYYYELATLETTHKKRVGILKKAVDYVEEGIGIYRGLGLQAEIATCLSNASALHSGLAGLETTRKRRADILKKAVDHVEEAVGIYRRLGLQADIAMSLNNASNRYSELAGLETTRKERIGILKKAVDYVEEAIRIYRGLGLQADSAVCQGTAGVCYRAMAGATPDAESQAGFLRTALGNFEEAASIFRSLSQARYLVQALRDSVLCHLELSRLGILDHTQVLALCQEGEALSRQMGDTVSAEFFAEVKGLLSAE